MRIGCDIDGVLADFNTAFIARVIHITGHDLFPPRPFDIPCWAYPQFYGYSEAEESAVWKDICADPTFWQSLPDYADTQASIDYLMTRQQAGDDLYFITSRPGIAAKVQTERWLRRHKVGNPTVLISSDKGGCCRALKIDTYIDDRWENVVDTAAIGVRTALLNRPWNTDPRLILPPHLTRVSCVAGFVD